MLAAKLRKRASNSRMRKKRRSCPARRKKYRLKYSAGILEKGREKNRLCL
jgi:hypothetical protein